VRDEGHRVTYTDPGDGPRNATWRKRKANPGPTRDADDLFAHTVIDTPTREIVGMVRGNDPIESQAAAVAVKPDCQWLRWRLLQILATQGIQTARDLESRAEFKAFGPSTVRKRISELRQAGKITQQGREDGMAKWGIA
jgi:hypothetical protein